MPMKTENKTNHYIDLHAHLDGCITVDIAKKLAALQQITLPAATDEELLSLLSVPDTWLWKGAGTKEPDGVWHGKYASLGQTPGRGTCTGAFEKPAPLYQGEVTEYVGS